MTISPLGGPSVLGTPTMFPHGLTAARQADISISSLILPLGAGRGNRFSLCAFGMMRGCLNMPIGSSLDCLPCRGWGSAHTTLSWRESERECEGSSMEFICYDLLHSSVVFDSVICCRRWRECQPFGSGRLIRCTPDSWKKSSPLSTWRNW